NGVNSLKGLPVKVRYLAEQAVFSSGFAVKFSLSFKEFYEEAEPACNPCARGRGGGIGTVTRVSAGARWPDRSTAGPAGTTRAGHAGATAAKKRDQRSGRVQRLCGGRWTLRSKPEGGGAGAVFEPVSEFGNERRRDAADHG